MTRQTMKNTSPEIIINFMFAVWENRLAGERVDTSIRFSWRYTKNLSEASLKQDQQKLASLQNDAQRSMASLQDNIAQAAAQAQKTINDSINAFIETYNKTRGYDAILFKAATLYINPQLDITDEVVEGLNARYNKVKK